MKKLVYKFTNKEGGVLGRGVTVDIRDIYRKGVGLAIQFHKPIELRMCHSEDERLELIGEYRPDLSFHYNGAGGTMQFDEMGNKIRG